MLRGLALLDSVLSPGAARRAGCVEEMKLYASSMIFERS
jgi:hypothetical protein